MFTLHALGWLSETPSCGLRAGPEAVWLSTLVRVCVRPFFRVLRAYAPPRACASVSPRALTPACHQPLVKELFTGRTLGINYVHC